MINSQLCQYLIEYLSHTSKSPVDYYAVESTRDKIRADHHVDFGTDVEAWVEWYMSSDESEADKKAVKIAYDIYLTRKKLNKISKSD